MMSVLLRAAGSVVSVSGIIDCLTIGVQVCHVYGIQFCWYVLDKPDGNILLKG